LSPQQAILPFSLEYHKQLPFKPEPSLSTQPFDTELKIAV
jgi:sec-independent protein translocase protein TatB